MAVDDILQYVYGFRKLDFKGFRYKRRILVSFIAVERGPLTKEKKAKTQFQNWIDSTRVLATSIVIVIG